WGVADAVHQSTPAVKNGWYPDIDEGVWRVHCAGVVDDAPHPNRWVVVVTTRYPSALGQDYGQETCSNVAARVLPPAISGLAPRHHGRLARGELHPLDVRALPAPGTSPRFRASTKAAPRR